MSQCTFTMEEWVWLEIQGEPRGQGLTPDDGGLVGAFLWWMYEAKVNYRALMTGGGWFIGRIAKSDAERVRTWLMANGAKPT